MSGYKYLILCALMVLTISFGTVYAADDLNQTELVQSSDDLSLTVNGGTFDDIQAEIDNASDGATIDLRGNFTSQGSEIHINKNLTIDGHKNTTLDCKRLSFFFYFDHVSKISVNGIKFINSEFYGDSVTRWNNGYADEYIFTNCDFQDNIGYFLEISSKKATFTDCNFVNNNNIIFMLNSEDLTVRNCNFINNTNQVISTAKIIDKCYFYENFAEDFDLMENAQSITNSKFIKNNFAITTVNTMYNNTFELNDFYFYAVYNVSTVEKCVFNKNSGLIFKNCDVLKDSRFENNGGGIVGSGVYVSNCKFMNGEGGDIFLKVSSIADSYFKNIKSCYIEGKNLVVKNSDFINVLGFVAAFKIDKCSFSKNELDVEADSISNCKFTKNTFYGNLIHADTVAKCHFVQNKCKTDLLFAKTVSNSKFIKNVCSGDLMCVVKTVSNCRFEKNNFAKSSSGHLVSSTKLLKNCVFKSNRVSDKTDF